VILAVSAQVIGELVDALGEKRDLDLCLTGIGGTVAELGDEFLGAFLSQWHAAGEASRASTRSAADRAGIGDVARHLLDQGSGAVKAPLAAQPGEELELQLAAVELELGVDHIGLHEQ
jgi:hypothetical protein